MKNGYMFLSSVSSMSGVRVIAVDAYSDRSEGHRASNNPNLFQRWSGMGTSSRAKITNFRWSFNDDVKCRLTHSPRRKRWNEVTSMKKIPIEVLLNVSDINDCATNPLLRLMPGGQGVWWTISIIFGQKSNRRFLCPPTLTVQDTADGWWPAAVAATAGSCGSATVSAPPPVPS